MEKKSLKEISLNITEEEYRKDSALSYSTLARFEREGFEKLGNLFESISTPSLTLGSCVDSIITGGEEEFNERFLVAEFPSTPDTIIQIVKALFKEFNETHNTLESIPNVEVIGFASRFNYQNNWKPETRAKVIKEKGAEYYNILYVAGSKTIISTDTYKDVINMVDVLRNSEATSYYFAPNNPFENVERFYQLKFKATLHDIDYRCMADLIVVNHDTKEITPVDLKTSGSPEYHFHHSFIKWLYNIQARLYWRIIRHNMDQDEYFKDFKLNNYKFIVVNKNNLDPMVWTYPETQTTGFIIYGKNHNIVFRDPEEIGKELHYYLTTQAKRPININNDNNLTEWLNTL